MRLKLPPFRKGATARHRVGTEVVDKPASGNGEGVRSSNFNFGISIQFDALGKVRLNRGSPMMAEPNMKFEDLTPKIVP